MLIPVVVYGVTISTFGSVAFLYYRSEISTENGWLFIGEILFIYRNDKWDLPKGRAEGKEVIEDTAMREVEEETGVEGLSISKQLPTTYHIFKRNGKYRIKITYWFEMNTSYSGKLTPQIKEGITKVKWLNEKEADAALENSYANIRALI